MNRRQFLINSSAVMLGGTALQKSVAQTKPATSQPTTDEITTGELTIDVEGASHLVPLNYNGLSYELAELSNPHFFAGSNQELIALFRLLSAQGVLRLGGNSGESCWFQADASTLAPELHQTVGSAEANWMPHRLFMIEPEAIDHLAEFLNATGWQLIYGLNLGNSSPERAAKEAEYVAQKIGERLLYFQIGNEPDYYHNANNGTRPAGWGFADYLQEWVQFADAVSERVPQAKFGGPDVGSSSDWIMKFINGATAKLGSQLVTITGHYYAAGPPDDPKVTTARLLRNSPGVARRTHAIVDAAAKDNLVYRLTEGNSCYRGGKPGMSDAFASALWAGDYMLALATAGCVGVNLHGGSRDLLRASLGNHMPGELVAKNGGGAKESVTATNASVANGSFYTPIAGDMEAGFSARPIFYGMLLANQLAGTKLRAVKLSDTGVNATAYAGEKDGQLRLAIFNKDNSQALRFALRATNGFKQAKVWRLAAPALDATSGITLAGAEISPDGSWSPSEVENLEMPPNGPVLDLPQAGAALLFLDS
jgi:hypothetical protein